MNWLPTTMTKDVIAPTVSASTIKTPASTPTPIATYRQPLEDYSTGAASCAWAVVVSENSAISATHRILRICPSSSPR